MPAPAKKLERLPVSVGEEICAAPYAAVWGHSGIVTDDSGLVTGHSGQA